MVMLITKVLVMMIISVKDDYDNDGRDVYSSMIFDEFPPPAFDFPPRDVLRRVTKSTIFLPVRQ